MRKDKLLFAQDTLLAVDIGNTNINIGVFKGERLVYRGKFPLKKSTTSIFKGLFYKYKYNDAIICNVVPSKLKDVAGQISKVLKKSPYAIGKNIKVPIKNLYLIPQEAGLDRLVNAFAGFILYGVPVIVIDFGTAITFDVVSKNKEFLGGMILPGLSTSLDALNTNTSKLPRVKLNPPADLIGRNTQDCMLSGLIYGVSCLVEGLVLRIKNKLKTDFCIVATGGDANFIAKYCKAFDFVDPDLTLKGLRLIYLKHKNE